MSTTLTIGGVDKASLINWKTLRREEVLTKEPNKLTFFLKKHAGQTYKPTSGDEVVLTVGATVQFGGYIVEIEEDIEGLVQYIQCTCKDYTHQLDRQLVSKTYTSMTVNAIIADLLSTFSTGITGVNVNCPVTIDAVTFNYLPISKCLEKLTAMTSGYEWYIDYTKDIHFFASALMSSSFNLSDTSGNYVFDSLNIREDTHQMSNEIIVRGGLLTSTTIRTEVISSDGSKKVFPLATKFSNLPAVTVNGSSITVGVENLDLPSAYTCLWNYNEKSILFASSPTSGTIGVTQYPQYPLILQKRSEPSITTYGLYQKVLVDKTIRDLDTATARADVELLKYAVPQKVATFLTYTEGLRAGDTINVQSSIRGINQDFKIQTKRSYLKTPNTDELTHEIDCVTAEDIGINDILTRLLVNNPSDQIDIDADESVSRIRQFEDSFGFTDSTPTTTKTSGPYLVGSTAIVGFFTMG